MPTSPEPPRTPATPPVALEATLEPEAETLGVRCEVRNRGADPVDVRLIATNGRLDPIPLEAYACYLAEEEALHLLAGQPTPSPRVDVYAPAIALSRSLEPGETIRHRYEIPLPVEEWNPHGLFPPGREEPEKRRVVVHRTLLTIEWLRAADVASRSRRDDYPPDFHRAVGGPVHRAQVTLETPHDIPVLVKTWDFPRF